MTALETGSGLDARPLGSAQIVDWRARDVQNRLDRIASMLVDRREALAAEIVRQISTEISDYSAPRTEALEHITEHINVLAKMVSGKLLDASSFDFIRPHAARRAQDGVPLASFLHAFRVGIRVLWDTAIEATGEDLRARSATLSAVRPFLELLNAASTQAAAAYMEAHQSLIAEGAGARRDLLEHLLAGRPLSNPGTRALAAESGLEAGARCAVIVVTHAGPLDLDAARSAIRILVAAAANVTRPLNVARHDELVIVRTVRSNELSELSSRLRVAYEQLRGNGIEVRIGVSTAHEGLAMVPAAYAEARRAADAVAPGAGVLSLSEMSSIDYLASQADGVAPRLLPIAVRELIAEDLARDGVLIETVLAYAESDMNLARAAERLHIHVNTARYRLGRISERTGHDPRSFTNVLDLVLAIKMLGVAPGAAHSAALP